MKESEEQLVLCLWNPSFVQKTTKRTWGFLLFCKAMNRTGRPCLQRAFLHSNHFCDFDSNHSPDDKYASFSSFVLRQAFSQIISVWSSPVTLVTNNALTKEKEVFNRRMSCPSSRLLLKCRRLFRHFLLPYSQSLFTVRKQLRPFCRDNLR